MLVAGVQVDGWTANDMPIASQVACNGVAMWQQSLAHLGERHAQGVGHEEEGQEEAAHVEAGGEPELVAVVQVVEPDGGPQGAHLGSSRTEAVGRGTHIGGVQLTCHTRSMNKGIQAHSQKGALLLHIALSNACGGSWGTVKMWASRAWRTW